MKRTLSAVGFLWVGVAVVQAQSLLTIYSGGFALVRDVVPLELKAGENSVRYFGATSGMEPGSVILRDPTGKVAMAILEQNYQPAPVNQTTFLERYEGQSIGFLVRDAKGERVVEGKVLRSGYVPGADPVEPVIEVEGKVRFELPGRPLFPPIGEDSMRLKPLLSWKIQSAQPVSVKTELSYLTKGLEWKAHYNLLLTESGDSAELGGWVSVQNACGKHFENARIHLVAGDVHRLEHGMPEKGGSSPGMLREVSSAAPPLPVAKGVDDYHLYPLPRSMTLRDQETKQVELVRSGNVPVRRVYTFEPAAPVFFSGEPVLDRDWAPSLNSNRSVESTVEFPNTEASGLGLPLPEGILRVYRRAGEQFEFVGEDAVAHTPRGTSVAAKLGDAFDLSGERRRMNFTVEQSRRVLEETFEVRLNNRSAKPASVRVLEHFGRAATWSVASSTHEFRKVDSQSAEALVSLSPNREVRITYTVKYTW